MAYDFKKLSDVEVVAEPAESANVLIEEDGVIKKAPKTAVGGGGVNTFLVYVDDFSSSYNIPAPDGLYDTLQNMFNNHVYVEVILYGKQENYFYVEHISNGMHKNDDGSFEKWVDNIYHVYVYPNGTMSVYYDD